MSLRCRRWRSSSKGQGCRETALVSGFLIAFALIAMAVGLVLINRAGCEGLCETAAVVLYASGLPLSAAMAFFFGDLVVAWPLDVTFWVVAGFVIVGRTSRIPKSPYPTALAAVVLAITYGLVISTFVEIAI